MNKSKLLIVVILLGGLGYAWTVRGDDDSTGGTRRAVEAKLAKVSSFYSEFRQERHVALFAEPLQSQGVMVFRRPDCVRWEISSPHKSVLLAQGRGVAQLEWVDGKWQRLRVGHERALREMLGGLTSLWRGNLAEQEKRYGLSFSAGPPVVLTMKPRSAEMGALIAAIEVWFAEDLSGTDRVVIREPDGDKTTITFTRQSVNVHLPDEVFDFKKPPPLADIKKALQDEESR